MSIWPLIEKLAATLHEHIGLVEEAKRGTALVRATMGREKREILETLYKLRLSRAKLSEELRALSTLDMLSESELEDLIALLGYYVEIAYVNELAVLLEVREFVNVDADVEALEELRREASVILSNLIGRQNATQESLNPRAELL